MQNDATLLSGVDHLAVTGALVEDELRMGLLEEVRANLAGRNVRCQRQHLCAVAVGVIEALNEVGVTRTARGRTHC